MLVQTTVFYLNYCNDLRSVLSALAPGSFSCSLFLSSLLRSFNDFLSKVCPLSCQSFLKSHFPLLFPTLTLDTLALLFLKISIDLSTSGPLCFLFPLPYHPMVSLGLVLTLSLELPSQRDLPQHSHLQFQVCNCGLIFLP